MADKVHECSTRTCIKCNETKPVSKFHRAQRGLCGRKSTCKVCANRINKKHRQKPEIRKARSEYQKTSLVYRAGRLVGDARRRARDSDLPFDLDPAWAREILEEGVCQATGLPFDFDEQWGAYAPSIDKLDPERGYLKDNCRIVLWFYNRAKGAHPEEEAQELFKEIANALSN